MELNNEELNAIVTTEKYKYYKDYVERLEKDYDSLLDEIADLEKKLKDQKTMNRMLRADNKALRDKARFKNQEPVLTDLDAQRYREMCIEQKKTISRLQWLLKVERAKGEK